MKTFRNLICTILILIVALTSAQQSLSLLNNQGCGEFAPGSNCTKCISNCARVVAVCAAACVWRPSTCKECIVKYEPWPGCLNCIPTCFHWGTPDAMVCVDCDNSELQNSMCLGSQGQLGFCVAPGDATFADNGGSGCGGSTPDCDIVSGAISQCPAPSYTSKKNNSSVASSASPVDTANSIPSEAPNLDPMASFSYTEIFRRGGRERGAAAEGDLG